MNNIDLCQGVRLAGLRVGLPCPEKYTHKIGGRRLCPVHAEAYRVHPDKEQEAKESRQLIDEHTSEPRTEIDLIELESRILFACIVAGKSAKFAYNATRALFEPEVSPFYQIKTWLRKHTLEDNLKRAKTGNYSKLVRTFKALVKSDLDLRTATIDQLEQIPGIGPKTSRFFILWCDKTARVAALDTHILKWLATQGVPNVPRSTPSCGATYARLEQAFLGFADKARLLPGELDTIIWEAYSKNRMTPVTKRKGK